MKNLINEMKRRTERNKYPYEIVSTELRLQRLLHKQTLARIAFSSNVSVSYVSRVEQNQIKPNRAFLNDACKALNISEEELRGLESLELVIIFCVEAYLKRDASILEDKIKGFNFQNYRFKIIKLYIALIKNEMDEAAGLIDALDETASCMGDEDLQCYCVAYALFEYKRGKYEVANDILTSISNICHQNYEYQVISKLYLFYIAYFANNPRGYKLYEEAFDTITRSKFPFLLKNLKYVYGLYLLNNSDLFRIDEHFKLIDDKRQLRTLNSLVNISVNVPLTLKDAEESNDFIKILYYKDKDRKKAEEILEHHDIKEAEFDFSYIIARYILLTDIDDKYNYIIKYVVKTEEYKFSSFIRDFFLTECAKLAKISSKYKGFAEMYLSTIKNSFDWSYEHNKKIGFFYY